LRIERRASACASCTCTSGAGTESGLLPTETALSSEFGTFTFLAEIVTLVTGLGEFDVDLHGGKN
jgi:hypothetical protein